jgi:hypothetical protein
VLSQSLMFCSEAIMHVPKSRATVFTNKFLLGGQILNYASFSKKLMVIVPYR